MLAVNTGVARVLELEADAFSKYAGGRAFSGIGFLTVASGASVVAFLCVSFTCASLERKSSWVYASGIPTRYLPLWLAAAGPSASG